MNSMPKWVLKFLCRGPEISEPKLIKQASPSKPNAKKGQVLKQVSFEIADPKSLEDILEEIDKAIDRVGKHRNPGEVAPKIITCNSGASESILETIRQSCQDVVGGKSGAGKAVTESFNVLCDVLRGAGNLHWVAAGLSVLAFVLDRMDMMGKNFDQCMLLLIALRDLGHHVVTLYPQLPEEDDKLQNATRLITAGAILCCNHMKGGSLKQFAFSSVSQDDFRMLQEQINVLRSELNLLLTVKIHRAILLRQNSMPCPAYKPEYPINKVGLDEKVDEVLDIVGITLSSSPRPGVRGVVLHGMGGIGKSTVGTAVYAMLPFTDRSHARVAVGKCPTAENIRDFQKDILEQLSGNTMRIGDCEEGRQKLRTYMQEKCTTPILLFIDNLFNGEHLEELLPEDLILPHGSRVIVTSRDAKACAVLEEKGVPCRSYPVSELGHKEARELLCLQVFKKPVPPSGMEDSVNSVLNICGGLPLALEVVGGYLRRYNSEQAWASVIESLQEWRPVNGLKEDLLTQSLMFSYDQLSEDVQKTYLDITSLLWDTPWDCLEPIYGQKLVLLDELALVKRMEYGDGVMRPQIHDLLLALGRSKEPGTRVRTDNEDFVSFLEDDNMETCGVVEGLFARNCKNPIPAEKLDAMHKSLRTLILQEVTISGSCTKIPRQLQLCITTNGVPYHKYLAKLDKLQVLIMSNEVNLDFASVQFPKQLKVLILVEVASLRCLPSNFGELQSLQTLRIEWCHALQELPKRFDQLQRLQTLVLYSCEELRKLPTGFDRLKCLQSLKLCYCGQLVELPEGFGQLHALENLDLCGCKSLRELPHDFPDLRSLQVLHLGECTTLTSLPAGFGNLLRLQELNLTRCNMLEQLPQGFENLTALQSLSLEHCQNVSTLPVNFSRLASLETLRLSNCQKICEVPADFLSLPRLRSIDVSGCNLTNMDLLEELRVRRQCRVVCENIENIECDSLESLGSSPGYWIPTDTDEEEMEFNLMYSQA